MAKNGAKICILTVVGAGSLAAGKTAGHAQTLNTISQPVLPADYDRGRNVSVIDKKRPDYDPIGIRVRSFDVFPRLDTSLGYVSNVYAASSGEIADSNVTLAPSIKVNSDWSRNQLIFAGGLALRRYFSEKLVNSDQWYANALGRVDLDSSLSLTAEAQGLRAQEEPFTSETDANIATLSRYKRGFFGGRVQYRAGRIRTTLAYDHTILAFDDVRLTTGTLISQADRDRNIDQIWGQVEYATSPSIVFFGQAGYSDTHYDRPLLLSGAPNRSSTSWRVLTGVNVDISGFLRGSVGIGYSQRNYNSAFYQTAKGLNIEGKLEYFPSELTTFTLTTRRQIDDASFANTTAFYSNRFSLRVDHELRRNLLVNAGAEVNIYDYIGSPLKNNVYRGTAGADLLLNRLMRVKLEGSVARRDRRGSAPFTTINDRRFLISYILQR